MADQGAWLAFVRVMSKSLTEDPATAAPSEPVEIICPAGYVERFRRDAKEAALIHAATGVVPPMPPYLER